MLQIKIWKKQSEYVISADLKILPDTSNVIVTGEDAINFMQLKTISHSISWDIEDGFVGLSYRKALKISGTVQNM